MEVSPRLIALLEDWHRFCPPRPIAWSFPGTHGRPQRRDSFTHGAWKRLSRVSGVLTPDGKPLYTRHSFRHLFASELIDKGANLNELRMIMGHSRPEFTLCYCGRLLQDQESVERRRRRARGIAEENLPDAEDHPVRQCGNRRITCLPAGAE